MARVKLGLCYLRSNEFAAPVAKRSIPSCMREAPAVWAFAASHLHQPIPMANERSKGPPQACLGPRNQRPVRAFLRRPQIISLRKQR